MTACWGIPDPRAVDGTPEKIERAYQQAFTTITKRISLIPALPIATMDWFAVQKQIESIGKQ